MGLHRDTNPWPLHSRCSALPTELWNSIHGEQTNLLSSPTRESNQTLNEMMWTAGIQMKWICDHCSCNRNLNTCEVAPKKRFLTILSLHQDRRSWNQCSQFLYKIIEMALSGHYHTKGKTKTVMEMNSNKDLENIGRTWAKLLAADTFWQGWLLMTVITLPSILKLQYRRISFRYLKQHSHGMHVVVRRLHLCKLNQCNAGRPDISLNRNQIRINKCFLKYRTYQRTHSKQV